MPRTPSLALYFLQILVKLYTFAREFSRDSQARCICLRLKRALGRVAGLLSSVLCRSGSFYLGFVVFFRVKDEMLECGQRSLINSLAHASVARHSVLLIESRISPVDEDVVFGIECFAVSSNARDAPAVGCARFRQEDARCTLARLSAPSRVKGFLANNSAAPLRVCHGGKSFKSLRGAHEILRAESADFNINLFSRSHHFSLQHRIASDEPRSRVASAENESKRGLPTVHFT